MLKLNTKRTFLSSVTVKFLDDEGVDQKGTFKARFKVLPADEAKDESNSDKRLLDLVLVEVMDLELSNIDGKLLEGEALLDACRNDPAISTALVSTYNEELAKKNLRRI